MNETGQNITLINTAERRAARQRRLALPLACPPEERNDRANRPGEPQHRTSHPRQPILIQSLCFLLILSLFTACRNEPNLTPTKGDPWPIALSISTNRVPLGTPFTVHFTAHHPIHSSIDLPSPESGKAIIQRNITRNEKALNEKTLETTIAFDLLSLQPGTHLLWTQDVRCVLADGREARKPLPDTRIEVLSVLTGNEKSLHGILGPVDWPNHSQRLILIAALVGLLILFALFFLILRRNHQHALAAPTPPVPPHIAALQALDLLLHKGWIEARHIEQYYVELSAILRTYLENRFRLRAPERTTEEFIHEAAHSRILSDTQQVVLHAFLEQSDLVKFARAAPDEDDMRNAYLAAKNFVEETKPAEPEEVQP
ncbi:MAG: hypothetical protein PHP44_08345 [Kiritimatiellae bacterium]|nr:hypothetical protein [Kiritimatiellia bacterium]